MAGEDKEEFPPLLAPGFHELGIDGVKRLCVDRFAQSLTRRLIMKNLHELIEMAQREEIRGIFWIDGSFLTDKLNPDDVDLVLVIEQSEFRKMTPRARKFFDWFKSTDLYPDYKCDNYHFIQGGPVENEYTYAYWLRQFGFNRPATAMKGLAVVNIPYVVKP